MFENVIFSADQKVPFASVCLSICLHPPRSWLGSCIVSTFSTGLRWLMGQDPDGLVERRERGRSRGELPLASLGCSRMAPKRRGGCLLSFHGRKRRTTQGGYPLGITKPAASGGSYRLDDSPSAESTCTPARMMLHPGRVLSEVGNGSLFRSPPI